MKSYLVIRSFASPDLGVHSVGDIIQLTDENAHGLGALVMPVTPKPAEVEAEIVETADLPLETVETAVKKIKKGKKV